MSLKQLLKNFCIDAYHELTSRGELPRPPYDSPLIAGNVLLTHWGSRLSKLPSHTQLQQYMRSSGLSDKLRDIGHTWLWHEEVFQWLFLERVMAESKGISLDVIAFNRVFRRAWAEVSRNSFRIRRITILNGLPKLNSTIELDKGVLLSPIDFSSHHYTLANLLGWRFQDRNRVPSFWVGPDDCLLIQDRVIQKGNEGRELLESRKQVQDQAELVIKALKLSLDTPIYPKAVYSSYLSGFPLLPILHTEFEEFSGFSISIQRPITSAEVRAILRNFKFISDSGTRKPKDGFFYTALDRFCDSFRGMQEKQSIVDLVVALEAMLRVQVEELRRRLATYTAFLLGTNDNNRRTFYDHVFAGYKLRSAIVHGGKDQEQEINNALIAFFPELEGKPINEVIRYVSKATEELQRIVRLVLRAYVYMRRNGTREKWPNDKDLQYLPFDPAKRRLIQKQLGITAKQPSPTLLALLG